MALEDVLLSERRDGIAIFTLNRPRALNALSRELRLALAAAFRAAAADPAVGAVILTGAGRAFCAGYDLAELAAAPGANAADAGSDMSRELIPALAEFPRPIIAAVNGHAITAGLELALACDLIVAADAARFADTHVRVGTLPGWGLSQRLPRLIGIARAKEMAFTGGFISAPQAAAWGLVNRVVAPEELLPACEALARDMLAADPAVLAAYKRLIDEGFALSFGAAMRHEAACGIAAARRLTAADVEERRAELQAAARPRAKS